MKIMFIYSLIFVVIVSGPAQSDVTTNEHTDRIMVYLESEGYEVSGIYRTLLGRVRIMSYGLTTRRDTVVNPNTGEVLMDHKREDYERNQLAIQELKERRLRDDGVARCIGEMGEGY